MSDKNQEDLKNALDYLSKNFVEVIGTNDEPTKIKKEKDPEISDNEEDQNISDEEDDDEDYDEEEDEEYDEDAAEDILQSLFSIIEKHKHLLTDCPYLVDKFTEKVDTEVVEEEKEKP